MKNLEFKNGDKMPALGLGTWLSKRGEVYAAVREALRIGYRHFDCAFIYANEAEIGNALKDAMRADEVKREELWITSKLWNTEHRLERVQPALEKALKDLQLDYLDLYLVHWPVALKEDARGLPFKPEDFYPIDDIPMSETWLGMEQVLDKGLCRHIGVSNFNVPKLRRLLSEAKHKPELNQIEMHPFLQQKDLISFAKEQRMLLTAYSPLGARGNPPAPGAAPKPDMFQNPVISEIATKYNSHPSQVMIQWAINRGTSVIPKSVNPDRLRSNFEAHKLELSDDDMNRLNDLDRNYRFVTGSFWTVEGSPYTQKSLWEESGEG